MNDYITANNIDPETVISLPNSTFVVKKIDENCSTKYSIFRMARKGHWALLTSSSHDDYNLSEEELLTTQIVGEEILTTPDPFTTTTKTLANGLILAGNSSRNLVNLVGSASRELVAWKNQLRIGLVDISGISGDFINKGAHLHFKNLNGLEASIVLKDGELALASIGKVSKTDFNKATKIFAEALNNPSFREDLLVNIKAGIEGLEEASKHVKNGEQLINKANELKATLNVLKN